MTIRSRHTVKPIATELTHELRATRKRELALAYRLFACQRWGDLGDGHITARDPERTDCFWLLPTGISYHEACVSDLVLVKPDGNVVGDGEINPSAYFIHHPIHTARPDVVSVAHVHTNWGTPFAAEARPIEAITQESCVFFENHALFDDEEVQVRSTDGGRRIADSLGTNAATILRNHGLLTVGGSVADAVGLFVLMERVAEAHMKARSAKSISAEAARYAKEDLLKIQVGAVGFQTLIQRHIRDPSVVDQ